MEILSVENLSFSYAGASSPALSDVSFSVKEGDFVAVIGATGSGKTTFLRMLKRELQPLGALTGRILYQGQELSTLSPRDSAMKIGYVMQRPEQQIVTDRVWHELAFGLENLGMPQEQIRRRVAEMASYFGIEGWFLKNVSELSGGQKQLLNLASVMVMKPDILLLDEPTAQLDPIAARDFLETVAALNRDLSLTVIIIEHRLEEVIPVAHKILALKDGRVFAAGEAHETVKKLREVPEMLVGLPAAVRISAALSKSCCPVGMRVSAAPEENSCPITVREGREWIRSRFGNQVKALPVAPDRFAEADNAVEVKDLYFRYTRDGRDVLNGLSFAVRTGEIFCLLGGNGSGKSTALSVLSGIRRAYAGSVKIFGKKLQEYKNQSLYKECVALLPQDVQTVFLRNSVREELEDAGIVLPDKRQANGRSSLSDLPFDLTGLLDRHPYDLSGGQQQLVALAKVLAGKPKLLLLDEPTKGLDADTKARFLSYLKALQKSGMTLVVVTHDTEFAAEAADRCALLFRGETISTAEPRAFFSGNSFYTTAANRIAQGYYDLAASVNDVVELCRANHPAQNPAQNLTPKTVQNADLKSAGETPEARV